MKKRITFILLGLLTNFATILIMHDLGAPLFTVLIAMIGFPIGYILISLGDPNKNKKNIKLI